MAVPSFIMNNLRSKANATVRSGVSSLERWVGEASPGEPRLSRIADARKALQQAAGNSAEGYLNRLGVNISSTLKMLDDFERDSRQYAQTRDPRRARQRLAQDNQTAATRAASRTRSTSSGGGSSSSLPGGSAAPSGGGSRTSAAGGGGGGGRSGGSAGSVTVGSEGGGPSDRLPGGYEVWKVGKEHFLVYYVPGSNTPMGWRITDNVNDVLGSGFRVAQKLTAKSAAKRGLLMMGRASDLRNTDKDPFDTFLDNINERAVTEPWLKDPEVLAQAAEAFLEGRPLALADLRETEWFNSRTDKERDWIAFAAGSAPAEVESRREDRRREVRDLLLRAGISDPPAQVVNFITEQDLTGRWSDAKLAEQVTALADPFSGLTLDPELKKAVKGLTLETRANDVRAMRERVKSWLGPFASSYTDKQLAEWAGMVRNDPNGDKKLDDILRGQRMALLPEYDNPDVRWQDAAAPWKSYLESLWGEQVDDSDPVLLQVVRSNDINEAGRIARREGVQRGVGGAVNELTSALTGAFGTVRRSL